MKIKERKMKNHKLIIIGVIFSVVVWISSLVFDLDYFEKFAEFIERFEKYELDELVLPFIILGTFVIIDLYKNLKAQAIEREKIKIYNAMLSSTHHIINNFLNQMLLFKVTADEIPKFPKEILNLFGEIISEASAQVNALSSIVDIDEESIRNSVTPKTEKK